MAEVNVSENSENGKGSQETDFEIEKSAFHWMRASVVQSLVIFCFIDFLLMVGRKSLPILEQGDSSILESKRQQGKHQRTIHRTRFTSDWRKHN